MLDVKELTVGYGDLIAARNLSFFVEPGTTLAIMGANGAGKSSTLMSLIGLVEKKSGSILMNGEDISSTKTEQRISKGISIVPEGRRVFSDLSVHENLMIGGHTVKPKTMNGTIEEVFTYFPRLRERKKQTAGSLSGGEQQMLAIGRALISQPKVLIIDELSLGLMPKVVDECYRVLQRLKEKNTAIILVEQNTERAFSMADRVYVLEAGNPIWSGSVIEAKNDSSITDMLMGIHQST